MKVQDLLETKLSIPVSKGNTSGILKSSHMPHLGTGVQAIAYYNEKFPNKVVKAISISGTDDPYYQFLRVCINHPGNPYFPKFFAVKQYTTSGDAESSAEERARKYAEIDTEDSPPDWAPHQLIVVTERLHHLKSNNDLAVSLLQECGILPEDLSTIKYRIYTDPLSYTKDAFATKSDRMELAKNTKDPSLKQALRLLEPLFNKFDPDLRQHNIMIRMSNGAPHIVLNDPIC